MKKIFIYFTFLLLANQTVFAQRDTIRIETFEDLPIIHKCEWLGGNASRHLTHTMNLVYQTPEGFKEMVGERISFNPGLARPVFEVVRDRISYGIIFNPRQERLLFITFGHEQRHVLRSIDGEMISFFEIQFNLDERMGGIINRFHHYLRYIQGLEEHWSYQRTRRDFSRNWRDFAYFFPPEMVKSEFNADMAALITLTIPTGHYFQEKYRYIDIFIVQSDERGAVSFISLYTDKAKQNIGCYRRRLMDAVHFGEESPPYIIWAQREREAQIEAQRRAEREAIPIIHEWLGGVSSRILTHDMRLTFQVPDGFKTGDDDYFRLFGYNWLLFKSFGHQLGGRVHSNDNEFVAFLQVLPISTRYVDTSHNGQMNAIYNHFHHHLQHNRGRSSDWVRLWGSDFHLDWRESAHFFSQEETRTRFNADTAAFFTLRLPREYYFEGRFRYVDVFMLQKVGRGYVSFVSFYTRRARRNIESYRRRLWGSLRYED